MTTPTFKQPDDVLTLNVLSSSIINAYRPSDTVLIFISQPVSLCIGHQDLVTANVIFFTLWFFLRWIVLYIWGRLGWLQELFIRQLFERRIPKAVLYIYCHGLRLEDNETQQYTTNIFASDLRHTAPHASLRDTTGRFRIPFPRRKWWRYSLTLIKSYQIRIIVAFTVLGGKKVSFSVLIDPQMAEKPVFLGMKRHLKNAYRYWFFFTCCFPLYTIYKRNINNQIGVVI